MAVTVWPTSPCCASSPNCSVGWRRIRRCGGCSTRSTRDGLRNIAAARAAARAVAWAAGAAPDEIVIDIDGTLVDAHSDKQDATPTYKRGFGFYPILAYLDATGEGVGRAAAPGSGRLQQRRRSPRRVGRGVGPAAGRRRPTTEILVRTDTAGATHDFIDGCVERGVALLGRAADRRRRARRLHAGPRRRLDPRRRGRRQPP